MKQFARSLLAYLPVTRQLVRRNRLLEQRVADAEAQIARQPALTAQALPPPQLIDTCFAALTGEKAPQAWPYFYHALAQNYDRFSESLGANIPENLVHLLSLLLVPVLRNGMKDFETKNALFDIAQSMGVHLTPVHFYNPLPNAAEIPDAVWDYAYRLGWNLNVDHQLALIQQLSGYVAELVDVPLEGTDDQSGFYWQNPAICPMDAAVYYALIRHYHPRRILEVGGGYSSLAASLAVQRGGCAHIEVIEPFPSDGLKAGFPGLAKLYIQPLQDMPLEMFETLEENDILFIDSTHVSKTGSDVNWLFFNILPRLKKGVLVHFHDILLPWDYPRQWVVEKKIFWNEEYLLLAFLLYNQAFDVRLAHYFLGKEHENDLRQAFPALQSWGGGSFWVQKVA